MLAPVLMMSMMSLGETVAAGRVSCVPRIGDEMLSGTLVIEEDCVSEVVDVLLGASIDHGDCDNATIGLEDVLVGSA